jgi:KDO2-lipid IV(A) lauroyltransferase
MRTCTGNRILYKKGALAESVKELRQGGVLGLLIDMSRRKDGIEIEFFGHRATATPAAALLAIRCSSPVLPAFCIRTSDGRLHGRIDPPLNIRRTGDLAADLRFNTQLMTNSLEKVVREFPEQWYWRQKRWKDFHPHLYLNK